MICLDFVSFLIKRFCCDPYCYITKFVYSEGLLKKKNYNGILKNAQGSSKNVQFESEHNFRLCFVKLKLLLLAIEVKPDDGTDSKVWKLKKCRVTDICVKREREGGGELS